MHGKRATSTLSPMGSRAPSLEHDGAGREEAERRGAEEVDGGTGEEDDFERSCGMRERGPYITPGEKQRAVIAVVGTAQPHTIGHARTITARSQCSYWYRAQCLTPMGCNRSNPCLNRYL